MMESPAPPGRPRDPNRDRAILDAAIGELADNGYENFSFEAIAKRTGASRTTIYRRYENKAELVVAAVTSAFETANPAAPNSGDAIKDITTLLQNTAHMLTATPIGSVMRAIIPALPTDGALTTLAAKMEKGRRQIFIEIIERGRATGQLDKSNMDARIDAALGAIYLRYLLLQKPLSRTYISRLVKEIFEPLNSTS